MRERNLTGVSESYGDLGSKGDVGGSSEELEPGPKLKNTQASTAARSDSAGPLPCNLPFSAGPIHVSDSYRVSGGHADDSDAEGPCFLRLY